MVQWLTPISFIILSVKESKTTIPRIACNILYSSSFALFILWAASFPGILSRYTEKAWLPPLSSQIFRPRTSIRSFWWSIIGRDSGRLKAQILETGVSHPRICVINLLARSHQVLHFEFGQGPVLDMRRPQFTQLGIWLVAARFVNR